jgi:tRNA-modifying protein YgfZ
MPNYCKLPDLGVIGFSGEDAQTFLHNQLTCDVNAVGVNQTAYGSYCTPKGRVLATFLLWRTPEGYFLQLPSALREGVQKRLSMYVLRAKVKVEDVSARWSKLGLFGNGAASFVERTFGVAVRAEHEVAFLPNVTVIRLPIERYEILVAPGQEPAVLDQLKESAEPAGAESWDLLDIRAGIPTITAATQEQLVPQMVNLDLIGGLSFSKGCYPGQEIVARMHFLGKLKQRTYLAHLETGETPQPGDKLYSADLGAQSSGMIVNAAPSPEGGFDVLAAIQISSAQGSGVHWKSPDGPPLKLLPLPYEVSASA